MIRVAVTGKGGVGKTTIAAGLAQSFARSGRRVIALDLDPVPNLALALGCADPSITPVLDEDDLIRERTGASSRESGGIFRLNPRVDDILGSRGVRCEDGLKLLVLGAVTRGGGGCFCPAHAFARHLIAHLTHAGDVLVMDMEAGTEHLGRGTTRVADILLIVTEPGRAATVAAVRIAGLGRDLGIKRIVAVVNKVRDPEDSEPASFLASQRISVIATFPWDPAVGIADHRGLSLSSIPEGLPMAGRFDHLRDRLITLANPPGTYRSP